MAKPEKPGKPPKPDKKKPKRLHGIVTAITFTPDTLTCRVKGKETQFAVSLEVVVSLNKQPAQFGDLLPGDNVFLVQDAAGALAYIDARRDDEDDAAE